MHIQTNGNLELPKRPKVYIESVEDLYPEPPGLFHRSPPGWLVERVHTDRNHGKLCAKLVPSLSNEEGVEYSLTQLVLEALQSDPNFPLRAADALASLVQRHEEQHNAQFSYGGWMEEREVVFRGTYMDRDRRYLHLGVDINVPTGTVVRFPGPASVLNVQTWTDNEVGWGTRVDLKHPDLPLVFIIGHLDPVTGVHKGDMLAARGQEIGRVGGAALNGNVNPHIHVQAMQLSSYLQLSALCDLDGYGPVSQKAELSLLYPHPLIALTHFPGGRLC